MRRRTSRDHHLWLRGKIPPSPCLGAPVKPDIDRIEAVDDEIAVSLRVMGPAKRLALVFQAERFARDLMRAGARNRHPEWNEADVEKEVARLWADGSV